MTATDRITTHEQRVTNLVLTRNIPLNYWMIYLVIAPFILRFVVEVPIP